MMKTMMNEENTKPTSVALIVASALFGAGLAVGYLIPREPQLIKLKPTIVLSYIQDKRLAFRVLNTDNAIVTFNTNMSSYLKFDWFYGNVDTNIFRKMDNENGY